MAIVGCLPFGPIVGFNIRAVNLCSKFNPRGHFPKLADNQAIGAVLAGGGIVWSPETILIAGDLNRDIGNGVVILLITFSDYPGDAYVRAICLTLFLNRLVFS